MADKKQKNSSRRLENGVDAQEQQQHIIKDPAVNRDEDRKIFIGGLKSKTTANDLNLHFGQFGEIQFISIKTDIENGRSRGFAFIVYKTTEGRDNALACTNHVILYKKVDVKKAVPRQVKLFVGGLSPYLTDDDIKDYFKRYAPVLAFEMPYDKVNNKRKSFCFITFESKQVVAEILKSPSHVIKGNKVYVRNRTYFNDLSKINNLRPLSIMQGNIWGQRGITDFQPQYGYTPSAPCCCYGGYYYNYQFLGYSPDYRYTYSYPCYGDSARADYQYQGYGLSAPCGGH
ncbi:RNA-binding protein squid-like [Metopolophium dirhodum]|uniref:RNA-binding protein squid-like n=1 Tax=Metopolophium dirhodum TaxID=44670 RepID=UPI0029904392|nr:RNA-binding protein squid-like [Metopolophium dirhodum]